MTDRMDKLLSGLTMKPDEDYLGEIANLESKSYLAEASSLRQQVITRAKRRPGGLALPYARRTMSSSLLRFVPGRWSIWSGPSFSGKTQFVRFLMTHAMREGEKVLFTSLEEDVEECVMEFCATLLTTRNMTSEMIDACIDWLDEKLWVFNHSGFIDPQIAIGAAILAARQHGVTQVVIDSLMMLDIRKDDYEGQKNLAMLLNRVTKQYGIHVHLIVHPRKGDSSQDLMDMYDIQGAQELVALAHIVAILQRTPASAKKRIEWGIGGPGSLGDDCAAILRSCKQRGEWNMVGTQELAYLKQSRQWAQQPTYGPRRFLPDAMYREFKIDHMGQTNPYDDPHHTDQFNFT